MINNSGSTGAVHVCQLDTTTKTWMRSQLIKPPIASNPADYGAIISVQNGSLVIGDPQYTFDNALGTGDRSNNSGAVYIYETIAP